MDVKNRHKARGPLWCREGPECPPWLLGAQRFCFVLELSFPDALSEV